jgi:hypothetical protein
VPRPIPTELDQRAAKLREQAAGLNREQADRQEKADVALRSRLDDAHRGAAAARSAASTAATQATDLHTKATVALDEADDLEQMASKLLTSGGGHEREGADDLRELAQLRRADAASFRRRAERAEHVAQQAYDRAEHLDREASQRTDQHVDRSQSLKAMGTTADQLEAKAAALEDAADAVRYSPYAMTPAEREKAMADADRLIAKADAITPDFHGVDDEALELEYES